MQRHVIAGLLGTFCAAAPASAAETWLHPPYDDRFYWRVAYHQESVVKTGYDQYSVDAVAMSLRPHGGGRWVRLSIDCPKRDQFGDFKGGSTRIVQWKTYDRAGNILKMGGDDPGTINDDGEGKGSKLFSSVAYWACPEVRKAIGGNFTTATEAFPFTRTAAAAGVKRRDDLSRSLTMSYRDMIARGQIEFYGAGEKLRPASITVANCATTVSVAGRPDVVIAWHQMKDSTHSRQKNDFFLGFPIWGLIVYHATTDEVRYVEQTARDPALAADPPLKIVALFTRVVGDLCFPAS